MSIGLLIADDHELVRAGLRECFVRTEFAIVGEAPSVDEALRLALDPATQVMLLDISWMAEDESKMTDRGLELLEKIRVARPDLAIVMYSIHDARRYVERCRRLGASGYLIKGVDDGLLLSAVRAVLAGEQTWPETTIRDASFSPSRLGVQS